MRYLLGGRRYERLKDNDFIDCSSKEIISIFNPKHHKLMQRVEVDFTSETPKKYHMNMYQKIRRLGKKRYLNPIQAKPIKKLTNYVIKGAVVCFAGRMWVRIPEGKTAQEIIEKYQYKIFGT